MMTIENICKFAKKRCVCAFSTAAGLSFVANQKTTSLTKHARNVVSFVDKMSTKHGIMHYIVRHAERLAPVRPRYKKIYPIRDLLRGLLTLGATAELDTRNARLRSMALFLIDTIGRQEVLSKTHARAFSFVGSQESLALSAGIFRVKTWKPGDADYIPPVLIRGCGGFGFADTPLGRLSTPHNVQHYLSLMKPSCLTVEQYLAILPEEESIFRKLDDSGRLRPISIAAEISRAMEAAGIDKQFKVHSTRPATGTAAYLAGVNIQRILLPGGWSSEKTFKEWYLKLQRELPCVTDPTLTIEVALRKDL